MTTPQRSATPVLSRQTVPAPRGYAHPGQTRPGYAAPRPQQGMRPQNVVAPAGYRPVAPRPAMQQTAPRPVSFLTVTEVAAIMRVSKMTVYRLVHGGEMAAVRVGRSFRVPETAVREYLAGARTDLA